MDNNFNKYIKQEKVNAIIYLYNKGIEREASEVNFAVGAYTSSEAGNRLEEEIICCFHKRYMRRSLHAI